MAYLIVQGGSSLYRVDLSTGVATGLTLPTGVTLSATRKPKFAVLNQWVVMVNSPTRNLAIDPEGIVRVLVPRAPTHPPSVAAGAGTGLTGAYQFATSFVVLNTDGDLLMESPLSPRSAAVTLANQNASLTDIATSLDTITARRMYRTTAGGNELYHLLDHDGNASEALINNTADASLVLLPLLSSTVTSPPGTLPGIRFKNITEWKSRVWAIADDPTLLDTVFVSDTNKVYAFPNSIVAYPTGQDTIGLVGFVRRKNQLGLLKRTGLWQVAAAANSTGVTIANLSVGQIAFETAGTLSPDTIVVVNDRAYWLGNDGVYEWSDDGVKNITDDSVRPWFTGDTYFNRTRFANAYAKYNKLRHAYELHLAAAGSSNDDRWVSFNLTNRKWYGPHKTDAFTPTHAAYLIDENGLPLALVGGSDGVVYTANAATFRDGAATAIDFDCYGRFHHGDAPTVDHVWGHLKVMNKIETAGTLTITPYVGWFDVAAGTAISHALTSGREALRRLGKGAMARLRFRQNTVNVGCAIYGYELPFTELGERI